MHPNWIRNARLWFLWSGKTCVRLQTTALGHLQQWFSVRVAVPIVFPLPLSDIAAWVLLHIVRYPVHGQAAARLLG